MEKKYKRILVKLSGESLCKPGSFGVDSSSAAEVVKEFLPLVEMGVQTAVVIGGGNFMRGRTLAADPHIERTTADYMGMLATIINAISLRDVMESVGIPARTLSAIPMPTVCEPYIIQRADKHLNDGKIVILAGGTGSPFFSTDTCASLRASELGADGLFKATKVDGVFDSDPEKNPDAKRYEKLSYEKILADKLAVMDLTAISMCMENSIPIIVLKASTEGNLVNAVKGQPIGTLVSE